MSAARTILIIAGEPSGDRHAAHLVAAMRRLEPDLSFFGIGGEAMRAEGVDTLVDIRETAVMGLSEVLRRYGFFRRLFRRMLDLARERRPAAVILVDYPGFNLRFAAAAKGLGLKVVYYICPQVWAWNRARIKRMAVVLDRLITIFPFEAEHFASTALRVTFAGHPLVDEAAAVWDAPDATLPWNGQPRIALLPGSRDHEIRRLLPDMLAAARLLKQRFSGASFIVAAAGASAAELIHDVAAANGGLPEHTVVVTGRTRFILRQARVAIVASGTATIEASLMLCPMVVVYRVAPLTYWVARRLVRVDAIGMVNLVAGERICPELIQHAVTPPAVADALDAPLRNPVAHDALRARLERVNHKLGSGGAAERAAEAVLDTLA